LRTFYDYKNIRIGKPQVVTIGFFDGFHKGHQSVARTALDKARELNLRSAAVTFHPLDSGESILLTTKEEKLYLLEQAGFDRAVILNQSGAWRRWAPEKFIEEFLVKKLNASWVVVGEDFRFGKNRQGNVRMLSKYKRGRFNVEPVKLSKNNNSKISSTRIRKLARKGKLPDCRELTGRDYFFLGRRIKGEGLGARLGFPTVNFRVSPEKILPRGVFSCRTVLKDSSEKKYGACYIGPVDIRMYKTKPFKVEVHLFEYSAGMEENLLGASLISKIREPEKFDNLEDLRKRIQKDIERIRHEAQPLT
jgi:riboflavin kinase/FMN adenylyltransferase